MFFDCVLPVAWLKSAAFVAYLLASFASKSTQASHVACVLRWMKNKFIMSAVQR